MTKFKQKFISLLTAFLVFLPVAGFAQDLGAAKAQGLVGETASGIWVRSLIALRRTRSCRRLMRNGEPSTKTLPTITVPAWLTSRRLPDRKRSKERHQDSTSIPVAAGSESKVITGVYQSRLADSRQLAVFCARTKNWKNHRYR